MNIDLITSWFNQVLLFIRRHKFGAQSIWIIHQLSLMIDIFLEIAFLSFYPFVYFILFVVVWDDWSYVHNTAEEFRRFD